MAQPRNIALQLRAWQRRNRYSDAEAAHELGVPLVNFVGWADGIPCRLANLIETRIGVPVTDKHMARQAASGIIRP